MPFDEDTERLRFARKGWSKLKVERALEGRQRAYSRENMPHLSVWTAFVAGIGTIANTGGRVTILIHFYTRKFSEEVVSVFGSSSLQLTDLDAPHEELYENMLVSIA